MESKNFKKALSLYEEMKTYEIHPNWVSAYRLQLFVYGSMLHKMVN